MTDQPDPSQEAVKRDDVDRAIERMEALGRMFMGADDIEEASLCYADAHVFRQLWAALTASQARAERAEAALKPFASAVFNDNGDVTLSTGHLRHADWDRARLAMRDYQPRRDLQVPPSAEVHAAAAQAREEALREAAEVVRTKWASTNLEIEQAVLALLSSGEERDA